MFIDRGAVAGVVRGKTIALVGSGPGSLDNEPGFIDSHDLVCRVNNYRTGKAQGFRTDLFYSFFGGSIKKTREELQADGVKLCLCKCPDSKFIESEWHRKTGKLKGTDFRYIYQDRRDWWFCDTYIPSRDEFMASFDLLDRHIPSTGFSAILFLQSLGPKSILLTGYDFFASRIHNVNEAWRPGNPDDPIGHSPERERAWLRKLAADADGPPIAYDRRLAAIMAAEA